MNIREKMTEILSGHDEWEERYAMEILSTFEEEASDQVPTIIDLMKNGEVDIVLNTPLANLDSLTINGQQGDDTLTIDPVNGDPVLPGGITFNGQTGDDTMVVNHPDGALLASGGGIFFNGGPQVSDPTGDVLEINGPASATVTADTGSGGIRVGREGVELLRQDDDEVVVKIGDGAALVMLQTGSGGIKIE